MAGLYDLIPGLLEAETEYKDNKWLSYAGIEPAICGVFEVKPFTLQMFIELKIAENSLLGSRKEPPSEEDVAQFLWRVSALFSRTDTALRTAFHYMLGCQPYADVVLEIDRYLARAWEAMPMWPGGQGIASACIFPAKLIHDLAKAYGWTEEYICDLPFRRLWQYENRILEERHEKYAERVPKALQLRAEYLNQLNAKLKEEAAQRN